MMKKIFHGSLLLVLLIVIFPVEILAYIDPGTGSYLFQILIAGIVAAGFTIRLFWRKILRFFRHLVSRKTG